MYELFQRASGLSKTQVMGDRSVYMSPSPILYSLQKNVVSVLRGNFCKIE